MAISFVVDEGNGGSGWKKSRTPATADGRGCPVKTQTEFGNAGADEDMIWAGEIGNWDRPLKG
jgi:hypothetical protein